MENEAIELFKKLKTPGEIAFTLFFNACAQLGTEEALNSIKQVSSKIVQSFQSNSRLLTSLLDGLVKCGGITYAENLFNTFKNKTVSMYKVMINGFLKENNCLKVLSLFNQMKMNNVEIDHIIWTCIIKCLSEIGDGDFCQSIVEKIPESCFVDSQIHNALINMWGKCGCVNRAKEIFEKMSQPNQIGYAAMINSYGLNGMGLQSIELYYQMPKELINEATYICVLNACSHSGLVNEALSIFKTIEIKTERIYTSIIDCLSRASFFKEAQQLVDEFERSHIPALPMHRQYAFKYLQRVI
ncbi:unnamed protein product [Rotaria socialis]|nr:unnamed protein product [Rotaria socialis]CAF3315211.1 unnamed protein product [Rotaria socialis]CAF4924599.1 unnamed protein product [Rotaria socialis]